RRHPAARGRLGLGLPNVTPRALQTALVGAGQMGRLHARVIEEYEGTDLVAVVDPSPEAEELAWRRRAQWLRSVDELLAGAAPDLAVVAAPTAEHAAVAGALIEAGVPVLVEKPIAATLEEGRALVDAAHANGVLFSVGHVEWFNPAVRELKARLD